MDIYKEIETLNKKVDLMLSLLGGDTVPLSVSAIAHMYNKPRTAMYGTYRYLLPNFGYAEDGCNLCSEWTRAEVIAWNSRPIEERKKEYKNRVFPANKKS